MFVANVSLNNELSVSIFDYWDIIVIRLGIFLFLNGSEKRICFRTWMNVICADKSNKQYIELFGQESAAKLQLIIPENYDLSNFN